MFRNVVASALLVVVPFGCGGEQASADVDASVQAPDAGSQTDVDAAPAAPDAAGEPPPPLSVQFCRPGLDGSPDNRLEDALIELLELAVPGSTVRVSLFHLTRTRMTDAFVAAAARGVDVRFVLDDDNQAADGGLNTATQALVDGLGAGNVTFCPNACLGTNINHNKTFLFSELADGSRDVSVVSSANLTSLQRRMHNNMVIVRDDPALFAALSGYWDDQRAQSKAPDYYLVANGDRATKIYAYPRASGDTLVSVLNNVDCAGGGRIRLAMSLFSDARVAIAEALAARVDDGCSVLAVLNEPEGNSPGPAVVSTLESGGVDVMTYPRGPDGQGVHSKYLLIESRYAGSANVRRLLWTGSHNYTGNALRNNDELLLRVEDDAVYAAFVDDWQDIASRTR